MLRRRNSRLNYKYDSEPEEIEYTDSDRDFNPEVICSPAKKPFSNNVQIWLNLLVRMTTAPLTKLPSPLEING